MIIIIFFLFINILLSQSDEIIIESKLTFEEAISGIEIPKQIINQLELIDVQYYSFDGKLHQGQILINKKVKNDVIEIFNIIKALKFPVEKVIPISMYNWDDEKSMNDNNTSAFNLRNIRGTKTKSYHYYGLAIDINPLQNPQIKRGVIFPTKAEYNPNSAGTLTKDSKIVKEFLKRGWSWGGNWRSQKDYQHFEKRLK